MEQPIKQKDLTLQDFKDEVFRENSRPGWVTFNSEWANEAAERYAAYKEQQAKHAKWNIVAEVLPDHGIEVLGFHPEWTDEDFNPDGICVCYQLNGEEWYVAMYCNYHDQWHTRLCGEKQEGHESIISAPLLWTSKPASPYEPREKEGKMAYKTENGICTITCDKCGTSNTATEQNAGSVFYAMGWGLFPNAKKYTHLCESCMPKKYRKLKRY